MTNADHISIICVREEWCSVI